MEKKYIAAIVAVIIIAAGLTGLVYYQASQAAANDGHVAMKVADSPNLGVSGVFMTFSKVSLHSNVSGWTNYSVKSQTIYSLIIVYVPALSVILVSNDAFVVVKPRISMVCDFTL